MQTGINSKRTVADILADVTTSKDNEKPITPDVAFRRIAAGHYKDKSKISDATIRNDLATLVTECKLDIDQVAPQTGRTAAHWAVKNAILPAIQFLLERNVNLHVEDKSNDRDTPLCLAAKSKNPNVRVLIFEKLAKNTMQRVVPHYKFTSKDSHEVEPNLDARISALNRNYNQLLCLWLFLSALMIKNSWSKELEQFNLLVFQFLAFEAFNKFRVSMPVTYNICGPMIAHLERELLCYKAVREGLIAVNKVALTSLSHDSNHVFLMICGWVETKKGEHLNEINQDTVLCNPSSGSEEQRLYIGRNNCVEYLQGTAKLMLPAQFKIHSSNQPPKFESLASGPMLEECKKFWNNLKEAFLAEAKNDKQCIGTVTQVLKDTTSRLWLSLSQKQQSESFQRFQEILKKDKYKEEVVELGFEYVKTFITEIKAPTPVISKILDEKIQPTPIPTATPVPITTVARSSIEEFVHLPTNTAETKTSAPVIRATHDNHSDQAVVQHVQKRPERPCVKVCNSLAGAVTAFSALWYRIQVRNNVAVNTQAVTTVAVVPKLKKE